MGELLDGQDHKKKVSVDKGGKYLTFTLADEEYGIGILKVKEIIGMMPITPVPQTPEFVKGVINLRGKVIPVVDLRLKFGMEQIGYSERTCIIVVEIEGEVSSVMMGTVVDSVSEVIHLKNDDIEETPTFGTRPEYELHSGNGQDGRPGQDPSRHRQGAHIPGTFPAGQGGLSRLSNLPSNSRWAR